MKLFFDEPEFDSQLLRALSYAYYGGADIGECLQCAARISSGDFTAWYEQWQHLADSVEHQADLSKQRGHNVSAKEGFLKASNYHRTALFFLYGQAPNDLLVEGLERHIQSFEKALLFFDTPVEKVEIPYENGSLPGYFFSCDDSGKARPCIIAHSGYDGTRQECYFTIAAAALKRRYNVLLIDGPGQGEMLIKRAIPMRHDWEKVITPVVDWLLLRDDVDPARLCLVGGSWASVLAPRAAAVEQRLAALVAYPGIYDPIQNFLDTLPFLDGYLTSRDEKILQPFLAHIDSQPMLRFKFRSKAWIHGLNDTGELFLEWTKYSLKEHAYKILCPTFLGDTQNEQLSKGESKRLYDKLTCPKKYVLFRDNEGAGEHCAAGAISLLHQRIFDWLDDLLQEKSVHKATGIPDVFELPYNDHSDDQ